MRLPLNLPIYRPNPPTAAVSVVGPIWILLRTPAAHAEGTGSLTRNSTLTVPMLCKACRVIRVPDLGVSRRGGLCHQTWDAFGPIPEGRLVLDRLVPGGTSSDYIDTIPDSKSTIIDHVFVFLGTSTDFKGNRGIELTIRTFPGESGAFALL